MPSTTATKKPAKKKPAAPPVEDPMEPVGPVFIDDEDESEPVVAKPVARNVGSLLNQAPAPSSSASLVVVEEDRPSNPNAPTPGKRPHAATLYWEQAKQVGPAHAKAALLIKLAERAQAHLDDLQKWGPTEAGVGRGATALREGVKHLRESADYLKTLPLGWAPPERSTEKTAKTLVPGTGVSVKETARKQYDGALEPEEMTGLTVVRHEDGKPKVVCRTAAGSKVVIPRAHLVVVLGPPPAKATETPGESESE